MTIYTWMLMYPYLAMFAFAFIIYTLMVNMVDEGDGMLPRYISVAAFPWVYAYYIHVSTYLMYGESSLVKFSQYLSNLSIS